MSSSVPKRIRQGGTGIGVLVLLLGFWMLSDAATAASLPFDLGVATAIALLGFVFAVWIARSRYKSGVQWSTVPDVEYTLETPAPGDEMDEMIYRMTELREGVVEFRDQINERLERVATAVVAYRNQCSSEEALRALEQGSWTDDATAASYFAGAGTAPGSSSLLGAVRRRFSDSDSAFERQLRAVTRALEATSDAVEDSSEGDVEADEVRAMAASHLGDGDEREQVAENVRYGPVLRTNRWKGVTAFGFVALGAGILAGQPGVLLASVGGFALAGYARLASPVPLSSLEVSRNVSETSPEPGDVVDVTVNVKNGCETFLPDLRLVDRVPPAWDVVDGTPRVGTALRSGGSVTFQYSVVVQRGDYEWPLEAVGRDVSGSVERTAEITPDTELRCRPSLRTTAEMPVRAQTSMYSGELKTREGGEGLEFHSVREYQPGDPKTRIDWKTYAQSGEFSTINFRKEHAARVVLLFDCRESAYVSPTPDGKHALDTAVEAAYDTFASLSEQGHLVGIAAFDGVSCWLGPSAGSSHVQRVRELFAEHQAFDPLPPSVREHEEGRYIDPMTQIRRQLPSNTQLFLFSPLTDQYTCEVARQLNGAGHLVTIVSPDPTSARTIGQRLARLERTTRIRQLRDHGIRVVDWDADRELALELAEASRRWTA